MSFISNAYLDELRSKVSVVDVVKAKVKLSRKGKDFWGCCPFHHEKTPSFTVSDEKGFYHCFGCSEHGDIVSFEMKVNHLSFVEAVEKLSTMAGMDMPKPTVADIEREEKRVSLFDVVEKACQFFQQKIHSAQGEKAMEYIKKRGMTDATIKNFRLGYAPSGNELRMFLQSQNITLDQMVQAGLCAKKDGKVYDYFRDRLMFPIMDRRGKVIAFGGRIMGDGEPKYLNSPENDLFHKSQTLYAYDKAKVNARRSETIIVVEGYMDVIALHQAGIDYAVAPLGTALTEAQITALWQLVNEPILCFDGDNAGRKAALRAVPRALPILKEGFSLRFLWLPEGQDPDDVIRTKGGDSFLDMVKTSAPLADIVWQVIMGENSLTTPEKKAQTEKSISETMATIKNETIRRFYAQDMKDRLYNAMYTSRFSGKKTKGKTNKKAIEIRTDRKLVIDDEKLKNLIAYVLTYPEISHNFMEKIAEIESSNKYLNQRLRAMLDKLSDNIETINNEDKTDFALNIEMVKNKYKRFDEPQEKITKDIDLELKSLALVNVINDIRKTESELILEYSADKYEYLKNLISERKNLEKELDF